MHDYLVIDYQIITLANNKEVIQHYIKTYMKESITIKIEDIPQGLPDMHIPSRKRKASFEAQKEPRQKMPLKASRTRNG